MFDWLPLEDNFITGWTISMIRALWQGGIVLGVVWLILLIFPRIQPTIRCWLWRFAYLKLLVTFLAGPLRIPWLFVPKLSTFPVIRLLDTNPVGQWITVSQPVPGVHPLAVPMFFNGKFWFLLWILGLGGSAIQLMVLWKRNRMFARDCYPAQNPVLLDLYQKFCGQLNIHKPPHLYLSNSLSSPSLYGIFQPKIILPSGICSQYEPEEIKLMLAHELAHYRRGDLFWNWLPVIARSLFFFNPLVWLAEREWSELPEICCDQWAVQYSGTRSVDYGRVLVKTTLQAKPKQTNQRILAGVTDFYRPGPSQTLIKRLKALESGKGIHPKWIFISLIVLVILGLILIIPWQLSPGIKFFIDKLSYSNYNTFNFFARLQADQFYIRDFTVEIDGQTASEGYGFNSYGEIRFNTLSGYVFVKKSSIPKDYHQIKVKIHTLYGVFQEKYTIDFHDQNIWANYSL